MAFLALASQKALLNLQLSFLQFRKLNITNTRTQYQEEMSAIQRNYSGSGTADEDPEYIYYEQLDQMLDSEETSLDNEISVIQNDISSLKTLVNNSIKSSCTLNAGSSS